ncbi:MAG: phosphoenolpyruvate--protein phosphotransferase [Desulfobacteraceae bacterium 4572_88]|nr:MAG: phosphoenolpyruvate--protein phosphotransferase [Desulfobacteraceae bacterium 4572_88]
MTEKNQDRSNLACDIDDLSSLLTESSDIQGFLNSTVTLLSRYLNADACSVYLYDEDMDDLILRAATGISPGPADPVRMKPGEGLVGWTFENSRPICEGCVNENSRAKCFDIADGDRFDSFLAVPIQKGKRNIGVITVQHEKQEYFNEIDVVLLRTLTSQIAGSIENARVLIDMHRTDAPLPIPGKTRPSDQLQFIKGESASGGYAFTTASMFDRSHGTLLTDDRNSDRVYTLKDFHEAVQKTSEQLITFQTWLADRLLENASLIFDAHFMILKDEKFISKIVQNIKDGMSPPKAVQNVARRYIDIFSSSENAYIREKVNDIEDLAGRILKNLYDWSGQESDMIRNRIVIAQELYPSDVLKLASEKARGIILVRGGVTSHVSILARSINIPLIIARQPELLRLPEGTPLLMDADIGNIYVNPGEDIIRQFEDRKDAWRTLQSTKVSLSPTVRTQDGTRIHLLANINLLSELHIAKEINAGGIGLYRTEFPFLIRSSFPSEEEQYLIYKRLFEEMDGQEITIRTLDIGGDKPIGYLDFGSDSNPALGFRSIRFSLHHRDVLDTQLRAILRAAAGHRHVKIMFPMISSLDEFRDAKDAILNCMASLKHENISHNEDVAIGMMVEVPSVIGIIRDLARESDFFSIGSNDFIQYTLAVDRSNEKVAEYYAPWHPAVLRGLARIVYVARDEHKDVSICGEMAHEPEYIPFLIGIGVRKISADPQFLPVLEKRITELELSDAEAHARELLSEPTLKGTFGILRQREKVRKEK